MAWPVCLEFDQTGLVTTHTRYKPFGGIDAEQTNPPGSTPTGRRHFAGHPQQENTGLQYMKARWMDPATGTFLSVDPVVADYADPQSYNAYSYARNNPIKLIDPSGMSACGLLGITCAGEGTFPCWIQISFDSGSAAAMGATMQIASEARAPDGSGPSGPGPGDSAGGPGPGGAGTKSNPGASNPANPQSQSNQGNGQPNVPDNYEQALSDVFHQDVRSVVVEERSPRARGIDALSRLVGRETVATTERDKIHLRDTAKDFFRRGNEKVILEEYYHVVRQWNTGAMTTWSYLRENGIFGQYYDTNRFEVEAKDFATRNRDDFMRLLEQR